MLPSYLHNNVFSAPNWTFVHGFCVLVPNYVANHVVFWSNFCRESRCFGDTFRPLKKLLVTQKGFLQVCRDKIGRFNRYRDMIVRFNRYRHKIGITYQFNGGQKQHLTDYSLLKKDQTYQVLLSI